MKRIFVAVLAGVLGVGITALPARAFSFDIIQSPTTPYFSGWFDATDTNGDGMITGSEVVGFAVRLAGHPIGPSAWGEFAQSIDPTDFFDLRYNLDGILGDDTGEFLRFGSQHTSPCMGYNPTPHIGSVTYTTQATLSGLQSDAPSYPDFGDHLYDCGAFGVTMLPVASFEKKLVRISGPLVQNAQVSPVPLPAGLPLVATGAFAFTMAAWRRRAGASTA